MADDYPTSLVEWMRRNGVASATLDGERITSLTLGTAPVADEPKTQPQQSAQEREQKAREQRRAVALRASGGPVPRLSEID